MDVALYDVDEGFFGRGHGAGRRGRDFVTAPEIGPLFGACVARALDGWWRDLGVPDPFLVVEAGAGSGRLAREIRRADPDCLPALRYVLVERSPVLRAAAARGPPARAGRRGARAVRPPRRRRGARPGTPRGSRVRVGCRPPGAAVRQRRPRQRAARQPRLRDRPLGRHAVAGSAHHDGRFRVRRGARPRHRCRCASRCNASSACAWCRSVPASRYRVVSRPGSTNAPAHCRAGSSRCWTTSSTSTRCCDAVPNGCGPTGDTVAARTRCASPAARTSRRTWFASNSNTRPMRPASESSSTRRKRRGWPASASTSWWPQVDAAWDAGAARGDLAAIAGRSRANEAAALTDPGGLGAHRVVTLAKSAGPSRSEGR